MQVLSGTNALACVPDLSDEASCPLVIAIHCTDRYQQLPNTKGNILLLCAAGERSAASPMAFISRPELP